ncbi:hypothetical protein AABM38_20580 [Heyndrickxia sp. MSNUG]|uniref:hypothetical protein n=1 Tax=Heyndrickxia sp. MSNUG TaxID=3136677 RepID=UPI003C30610E
MYKRYTVISEDSFYHSMTGKLIEEFPKTYLLEFFRDSNKLGGLQRVMFFKYQVKYDGEY